jgi:hypothetical protein
VESEKRDRSVFHDYTFNVSAIYVLAPGPLMQSTHTVFLVSVAHVSYIVLGIGARAVSAHPVSTDTHAVKVGMSAAWAGDVAWTLHYKKQDALPVKLWRAVSAACVTSAARDARAGHACCIFSELRAGSPLSAVIGG